ncbi:hypothetical protein GGR36_000426 [Niveibacterium umoris]|uniref:Uncharacterized protein n=1 Tax=Niveibacterium umoris TaxID=1193620 RepID=A0A840BHJ2_9RHOO|nr:hypothetical protein [Niveibacterium umoris]
MNQPVLLAWPVMTDAAQRAAATLLKEPKHG